MKGGAYYQDVGSVVCIRANYDQWAAEFVLKTKDRAELLTILVEEEDRRLEMAVVDQLAVDRL